MKNSVDAVLYCRPAESLAVVLNIETTTNWRTEEVFTPTDE